VSWILSHGDSIILMGRVADRPTLNVRQAGAPESPRPTSTYQEVPLSISSKKIRAYYPNGTPVEYDMPYGQPPRSGTISGPCTLTEGMWWVEGADGYVLPIPEARLRVVALIV